MTTIALNYSQNLLNRFWKVIKNTLQRVMLGYILARQGKANAYIASRMIHEYPGHTVESLTHELNSKSFEKIRKEFGRA